MRNLFLLAFLTSIFLQADAFDFELDRIYYNIINEEDKTVEVTFKEEGKASYVGSVTIPHTIIKDDVEYTVTHIGKKAFYNCTNLTKISLPNSIISIKDDAFYNCNFEEIEIPGSVSIIGKSAFTGCSKLSKVIFYKGLEVINDYAFQNCTKLSDAYLPMGLQKIGDSAFAGTWIGHFKVPPTVTYLGNNFYSHYNSYNGTQLTLYVSYPYQKFTYFKKGWINCLPEDYDNFKEKLGSNVTVGKSVSLSYNNTQKTISINGANPSGSFLNNVTFQDEYYEFNGTPIQFDNLITGSKNKIYFSAVVDGYDVSTWENLETRPIDISRKSLEVSPTTINLTAAFSEGDSKVIKVWWNDSIQGETISLNHLKPETSYTNIFHYICDDGYIGSKEFTTKTSKLELELLYPKCVNSSEAIVAAQTNMSDEETNAGFQWRKFDAPSTLPSNEAYSIIYDGTLEGLIKNLQSSSYYDVRAFYKDLNNKYYYSEWVTFDPSDFSYFEPTVHTYDKIEINANSVTLKGYALKGSDDIISQGFQYWKSNNFRSRTDTNESDIYTITTTGQAMTVTLEGLDYGDYTCRAFIKTDANIFYGEELNFSIETSAIHNPTSIQVDNKIIGYYDTNGIRYSNPKKGFNIVKYNDGSSKKLWVP